MKHSEVRREWIERILINPVTTEIQADGRVSFRGIITFGGRALRVIEEVSEDVTLDFDPDGKVIGSPSTLLQET